MARSCIHSFDDTRARTLRVDTSLALNSLGEARHATKRVTILQLGNVYYGKISMQDTSLLQNYGEVLYP